MTQPAPEPASPPHLAYAASKPLRISPAQATGGKLVWFLAWVMLGFAIFMAAATFDRAMLERYQVQTIHPVVLQGGVMAERIVVKTHHRISWPGTFFVVALALPPAALGAAYLFLSRRVRNGDRLMAVITFLLTLLHTLAAALLLLLFFWVGMSLALGPYGLWWQRLYAGALVVLMLSMLPLAAWAAVRLFDAVARKRNVTHHPRAAITAAALAELEQPAPTDEDSDQQEEESEKPT